MKPRTGDHSWLRGDSRTWRWNEGTYEGRGEYDAVEAGPNGLSWYHWGHGYTDGGAQARQLQSFEEFSLNGPLRAMPDAKLDELRAWLVAHGHVRS